ncbi:MAG TPA: inner membrane-spanning protein YciB, partial [Burkholderiaceae bacterium]|nr:inner membrane-spanning protein YciB [Burkholderiaceae bacterium]
MKILFDLFPVVLFFVSFKLAHAFPTQATTLAANTLGLAFASPLIPEQIPIVLATVIAIGATIAQVGVLVALKKKIEPMVWISLAIIVIFGGATVYLQDETFIKWKPTILYWAFAGILAVGAVFLKKNFVRLLLGQSIQLPDPVWAQLGWAWTLFFLF